MSDKEQVAQAETKQATPAQEPQGPDLTVQDLQSLKSIIDVATQRGAFKASELMVVGQTYNKLDTFLAAVAKQQPAKEGA